MNAPSYTLCTGLKRLESGALIKDYEGSDKEIEQAVQMVISEVASEDPRFLEKDAPPLSEEFPDGTNIFFLGEHAYGVAAQVSSTTDSALSVVLAVCCKALTAMSLSKYPLSSSLQIKRREERTPNLRLLLTTVFLSLTFHRSKQPPRLGFRPGRSQRLPLASWSLRPTIKRTIWD